MKKKETLELILRHVEHNRNLLDSVFKESSVQRDSKEALLKRLRCCYMLDAHVQLIVERHNLVAEETVISIIEQTLNMFVKHFIDYENAQEGE